MKATPPMRRTTKITAIVLTAMTIAAHSAEASNIKPIADENGFIAHKALYTIKLDSVSSGSQIANISGQMYYEWAPDCEGWNSTHRFNLFYEYADAPSMTIASDFSTFESFDGKTLNYVSSRKQDGELIEEIQGRASIDEKLGGAAEFVKPKDLSYALPPKTLFPMAHSQAIVKAIKDGKKLRSDVIYDGSDDGGPVAVNTFIGKDIAPIAINTDPQGLLSAPAKNIHMAFFPLSEPAATPDYEMTMTLHENSLISLMNINYGDFSVEQNLIAAEAVADACERPE